MPPLPQKNLKIASLCIFSLETGTVALPPINTSTAVLTVFLMCCKVSDTFSNLPFPYFKVSGFEAYYTGNKIQKVLNFYAVSEPICPWESLDIEELWY